MFDENSVAEIAQSIGVTNQSGINDLHNKLRDLPDSVARLRTAHLPASPSAIARSFSRIESSCEILIRFLSIDPRPKPYHEQGPEDLASSLVVWRLAKEIDPVRTARALKDGPVDDAIQDHISKLKSLLKACQKARSDMEEMKLSKENRSRHGPDWVREQAVLMLFDIFFEATGEVPTITENGPSVRFLSKCLPALGWSELSDNAIRETIKKVKPKWKYRAG